MHTHINDKIMQRSIKSVLCPIIFPSAIASAGEGTKDDDNHRRKYNLEHEGQEILDQIGKYPTSYNHPRQHYPERGIPHIRQDDTWDCGLACIQMILEWLRAQDDVHDTEFIYNNSVDEAANDSTRQTIANTEKAWLIERVATKSIWTIDLVILLQYIQSCNPRISNRITNVDKEQENNARECHPIGYQLHLPRNFSYLFCSTKFGVETSYNSLEYYQDAFPSDELRIQNHFLTAHEQKLPLLRTSHLPLQVLVDVISHRDVAAIVLLDNVILRRNFSHPSTSESYSGHYVILCGISTDEGDIEYAQLNYPDDDSNTTQYDFCIAVKNPASWKQIEFVTPSILEKAWRARGTDEDVIFIAKHAREMDCLM